MLSVFFKSKRNEGLFEIFAVLGTKLALQDEAFLVVLAGAGFSVKSENQCIENRGFAGSGISGNQEEIFCCFRKINDGQIGIRAKGLKRNL